MTKHSKLFDHASSHVHLAPLVPYSEDTQRKLEHVAFIIQHLRRWNQYEIKFRPERLTAIAGRKDQIAKWERKFARMVVQGLRSALRHLPHNHPKPTPPIA